MLINIPFRVYGMLLRDNHRIQQLLGSSAASSASGIATESAAADASATSLGVMNQQLATAVLLMGALSEGAAIPGMAAGETAAGTIVAAAVAGGAAVPSLQHGGMVEKTGLAVVHEGEPFGGVGGGGFGGGDISITNHISVDPQGMSLTDFTNAMNEQMRLGLRKFTRDIPI